MQIYENGVMREATAEEIAEAARQRAKAESITIQMSVEEVLKLLAPKLVTDVPDETAIRMVEYFPHWEDLLGQYVEADTRVYDNGYLWKVIQPHTFSSEWRPEVATSLFTKVQIQQEQGTKDNPIEYSVNMELIQGKYYVENGILYLCIRPLAQSVWELSALVGNYVEVVNE